MSCEQAGSLPTAFGTAKSGLFDVGRLQRGQRVLIHDAAGGVESMAVQQAHLAGAYVIATASARNIDLVLDTLGCATLEKSWAVLRGGGRIATLVEPGIEPRHGYAGEFVFFAIATPLLA